MTLEAIPHSWFSSKFTIRDKQHVVAELDFGFWRENGTINLGQDGFHVHPEHLIGGDFILEGPSGVVARAEKPSAWVRRLIIEYSGKQYELRTRHALLREFVLLDSNRKIGSVSPQGILTRRADARLPEDWPLSVRMFVLWLVLLMWRREMNAAAAAGGGS